MEQKRDATISITIHEDSLHINVGRGVDVSGASIERIITQLRAELLKEARGRQETTARRALAARLARRASSTREGEPVCVGEALWIYEYRPSQATDRQAHLVRGGTVTRLADDGTTALVRYTLSSYLQAHAPGGTACGHGACFLIPLTKLKEWQRRHETEGHRSPWDCQRDEPEDERTRTRR